MIHRRQIILLHAIAGAGVAHFPGGVDAKPADRITRPAAPVALDFKSILGGEYAAPGRHGFDLKLEIAFLAKQPEAVAHFPRNLDAAAVGRRGCGGRRRC